MEAIPAATVELGSHTEEGEEDQVPKEVFATSAPCIAGHPLGLMELEN